MPVTDVFPPVVVSVPVPVVVPAAVDAPVPAFAVVPVVDPDVALEAELLPVLLDVLPDVLPMLPEPVEPLPEPVDSLPEPVQHHLHRKTGSSGSYSAFDSFCKLGLFLFSFS